MFRKLILPLALALSVLSAACATPATPINEPTAVLTTAPSAAPPTDTTTLTATPEPEPSIGGFSAKSISVEAILDLQPDLVIAGSKRQKDVIEALEGAGITVFALAPNSLADIESGILTLGEITGNLEGAEVVVTDMQSRISAISEKVGRLSTDKRPKVFYEVFDEPLTTTTKATFVGELLALAGAIIFLLTYRKRTPTSALNKLPNSIHRSSSARAVMPTS